MNLFLDRAHSVVSDFSLAQPGEADAIVEICRRFDGIPLAIELAASRIASIHRSSPKMPHTSAPADASTAPKPYKRLAAITLDIQDRGRKPYYRTNTKWCCQGCNRDKGVMTRGEFEARRQIAAI